MTSSVEPVGTPHRPPAGMVPGLTSLRGIAAWWVVLYHFREFLPGYTPAAIQAIIGQGYLAVDFFFELSGFVITLNYAHKFKVFTHTAYFQFLALRLARIYPLHAFMMLLFLVNPVALSLFSHAGVPPGRYGPSYFLFSLALMQCWGFTPNLAWNIPAWSISTELAAYLAFPFVIPLLRLCSKSNVLLYAFIASLFVVLAVAANLTGGLNADISHFGIARCLLEFSAGSGLYFIALHMADHAWSWRALTISGVLTLLIAYAAGLIPDEVAAPPAMFLILLNVQSRPSWVRRGLEGRLLVAAGEVSYSTYLFHYFAKDWLKLLTFDWAIRPELMLTGYIAFVITGSIVLFRFIEVPSRSYFRRRILSARPASISVV